MSKQNFKDQCDLCGKFDYCKGFDDMILCGKCLKKQKDNEIKLNKKSSSKKSKEGM